MDNTEEKQQYLRTHILDPGYKPSQFAGYLSNEREDGDDIDNWSIGSLIDVVKQFKEDNPEVPEYDESDLEDDYETDESVYDGDYYEEDSNSNIEADKIVVVVE